MAIINAVAYARYSSDKQQESSIVVQLSAIRKFCANNDIDLVHEYVDEAQTGTNTNRKQFQQMIRDAPNGEFKLVIVHRLDRWARNVDDARYYKKYLANLGIKILSAVEEFDESPEGEFFELMSMGMAELYSKKLSREAIAGKIANAKLGKIHGGLPALGYRVKGKYYVIEEKEAEIVKLIFDMTLKGYGYTAIRDYLNDNGYRRSDGRKFSGHFHDILRNKKYTGEYIYNKAAYRARNMPYNSHAVKPESEIIRIPNGMPQIIDLDTFNKVQRILDMRRRGLGGYIRSKRKYLLSGLLRCKECGKALCGGQSIQHKSKYPIYSCVTKGKLCKTKAIVVEYLDEYILALFSKCLLAPNNRDKLVSLVKASYIRTIDRLSDKKQAIISIIEDKQSEMRKTATRLAENESKPLYKYYTDEIENLTREIKTLEGELATVELEISSIPNFSPIKIERKAKTYQLQLSKGTLQTNQEIMRDLLQVIWVDNETLHVVIYLQKLLGSDYPIVCTVLEKRDSVAIRDNHSLQTLMFSKLAISLEEIDFFEQKTSYKIS